MIIVSLHKFDYTGLFKGSIATCLRDAPSSGIYYAVYQKTKSAFPSQIVLFMTNNLVFNDVNLVREAQGYLQCDFQRQWFSIFHDFDKSFRCYKNSNSIIKQPITSQYWSPKHVDSKLIYLILRTNF